MTYTTFKDTVREYLVRELGDNFDVDPVSKTKNNNIVCDALSVRKHGSDTGRMIDLNAMYQLVSSGAYTMQEMMRNIANSCMATPPFSASDVSWIRDFQAVSKKICCKLVNTAANAEMLKTVPSVPCLDLSVVFHVEFKPVDEKQEGFYVAKVTNRMMDEWGITAEELYPIALANTERLYPGTFCSMEQAMAEIERARNIKLSEEDWETRHSYYTRYPMYILSCLGETEGAIALLYPGVLKKAADKIGCDVFIIPSSIHEWILIPDNGDCDPIFINTMIDQINHSDAIKPEDVLANHAYRYARAKEELRITALEDILGHLQ